MRKTLETLGNVFARACLAASITGLLAVPVSLIETTVAHGAPSAPTAMAVEQQAKQAQGPWYRGSEYINNGACMPIDRTPAADRHANDDASMTTLVRAETDGAGKYAMAYQYHTGQYEVYSTSEAACNAWMRRLVTQATQ